MLFPRGFLFPALIAAAAVASAPRAQDSQDGPRVAITPREPAVQARRPPPSIRFDVNLVLIPVTVADAMDRPVTNLTCDNFRLLEDGAEQSIKSFAMEDGPISLGLLVDTSGSMKNRIDSSVAALELLYRTVITGDEFFVVQFADRARLLGGFTSDPEEFHRRLGLVQARGWTALLDALALSAHQMRLAQNERRVLLILSDGNDNNSRFSEAEVRKMVVEANLRIYGIGILNSPKLLRQLAEETGGKLLVAKNLGDLPDIVQRLSREIRSHYVLGYSPLNQVNDGKYRKVKVELLQPPGAPLLRHHWRRGYYAPAE